MRRSIVLKTKNRDKVNEKIDENQCKVDEGHVQDTSMDDSGFTSVTSALDELLKPIKVQWVQKEQTHFEISTPIGTPEKLKAKETSENQYMTCMMCNAESQDKICADCLKAHYDIKSEERILI